MHQLAHQPPRPSRRGFVGAASSFGAPSVVAPLIALLFALLAVVTPDVAAGAQTDTTAPIAPPPSAAAPLSDATRPKPSPTLAPESVVSIQLDALQHNDTPSPDFGIQTVFTFASPANRVATGPFDRFASLVKAPVYRPMLNFVRAERAPVHVDGDRARQRVTVVTAGGSRVTYIFLLSRQQGGEFDGCWMTDGVSRVNDQGPLPAGMRAT